MTKDGGIHEAIVISGQPFDWEKGKEAMNHVIREDGSVNMKAAMFADPGITTCPKCGQDHWAEGERQRCTACAFEYPTWWYSLVQFGQQKRLKYMDKRVDTKTFYYKYGVEHPDDSYEQAHDGIKALILNEGM